MSFTCFFFFKQKAAYDMRIMDWSADVCSSDLHYTLEMQSDLDTKGSYEGRDSEHGIRFRRGGEELSLHRGDGDETGLKYLAGKKECLIVKTGEGYCRY